MNSYRLPEDRVMDQAIQREIGRLKCELIRHGRFMALFGFALGVLIGRLL